MEICSSVYPEQLEVTDLFYLPGSDRLNVGFARGGRLFNVICSGALFPSIASALELQAPGQNITSLHEELAALLVRSFHEELHSFESNTKSLMSFLYSWTIEAQFFNGHLIIDPPTCGARVSRDLFRGVDYSDEGLAWHPWDSIEVLERISDTHFQVTVKGEVYGCYVPNGTFEPSEFSIFLAEVQAWKRISASAGIESFNLPLLKGLICSRLSPPILQGVLFEWIEPCSASPKLSKVHLTKASMRQRRVWALQIQRAVAALHERDAVWRRKNCKTNITDSITIAANGEAYLSNVHFGSVETYGASFLDFRFRADKEADYQALAEIRKFLEIETGDVLVCPVPFRFLELPGDIRNMVYERLLIHPGYIRWFFGYRLAKSPSHISGQVIPGYGLLGTNRQIRKESISMLIGRNNLLLDSIWMGPFLQSTLYTHIGTQFELNKIGSYLKHVTLTLSLTADKCISKEQHKWITEMRRICRSLSRVDILIYNRRTWNWEEDVVLAELEELEKQDVVVRYFQGNAPHPVQAERELEQ